MADQFGMTGLPGANTGGVSVGTSTPASSSPAGAPGGTVGQQGQNPLVPQPVMGQNTAPMTSSVNLADPNNFDVTKLLGGGPGGVGPGTGVGEHDWIKAMKKGGFSSADAAMLWNFLQSGAGFNPAVAQALIAAMQPGIQRGQEDILEQFSAQGLRGGSPAAIGLSNYMGQVQLNEGQIWANLYEESVKNYMTVLLAGKAEKGSGFFDNLMKFIQTGSQAAIAGATAAGGK